MKTKNLAHFTTRRSAVLAGAFLAMVTGSAYSTTALYTGSGFSVYPVPNDLGETEVKIYGNNETGSTVNGSIAVNNNDNKDVYWTTTTEWGLDVVDGHATIKGGKNNNKDTPIYNVTFGVYGSLFKDVEFKVDKDKKSVFSITATFADDTQATILNMNPDENNKHLLVLATDKLFKTITINSNSEDGIKQLKEWYVSDVKAVPLPAAAYLFGSALLGMAGIGYRRNKKQA